MNQILRQPRTTGIICFLLLAIVTLVLFTQIFNRENSLSYSIGYNLYGAERVLEGEIPYRDFHTLYPPAIVYLNAALFKLFGVSLCNALFGVLVFKMLTTWVLYFCARRLMPCHWALGVAAFSLLWLRPNGAFKAVPMHYGALFLSLALFFLLSKKPAKIELLLVGVSLGFLALFKHNIGAYAFLGTLVLFFVDEDRKRLSLKKFAQSYGEIFMLVTGSALVVLPVLAFMQSRGALKQMVNTLLFGPGEFLLNRLAAAPLPFLPILFFLWLIACAFLAYRFQENIFISSGIVALATLSIVFYTLLGKQNWIDPLIFYTPVLVILVGLIISLFTRRFGVSNQREILAVTLFTAAAFMEAFPRFAREQSIAAMPFVALLLFTLLYSFRPQIERRATSPVLFRFGLLILPIALFLIGVRLFAQTYFNSSLHFKSDTELSIARGKGVFFPAEKASEIDNVVDYIQERVPGNGYFFAQSYAGSSFLFLANRRNPSGAQFWGGVGVKEAERVATLEALEREQVNLIVTNCKDLETEKYEPMRRFISENFRQTREFGDVLILEK